MVFQEFDSPELYRSILKGFCLLTVDSNYRLDGKFLPDGFPELIILNKRPEVSIGKNKSETKPTSIFGGQSNFGGNINVEPPFRLVGIKFQPWAINNFLHYSIKEFTNGFHSSNESLKLNTQFLEDHFDDLFEQPELIWKWVETEVYQTHTVNFSNEIKECINLIFKYRGDISINKLHQIFPRSKRSFENTFKTEIGISPKQYCRIIRIRRISETFKSQKGNLTQLAYDYGYFDQAHFINDFKKLTSLAPSQYLKNQSLILSTF